jgi:hypothetical protein
MTKDEIQKVTLGTNEALRVTADGEFIWHPEADAMIAEGDFTSSPAMRHILRALRKALAAPVKDNSNYRLDPPGLDPASGTQVSKVWWDDDKLMAKPIPFVEFYKAAPDLQAELDATNRQVEILSDALAESRREIAALKAVHEPVAEARFDGTLHWLEPYGIGLHRFQGPLYTTPTAAQPAPPECQTEAEKTAFAFGWWKALESVRQPAVPDAFGTREGEHSQYVAGWNDCRAEMLKGKTK